jgi:hypothetical protein
MPWGLEATEIGLELLPGPRLIPAYREIIITVPRQSAKTTLALVVEVQRAVGWPEPQRIAYSAQNGVEARRKLLDDQEPILRGSPLWPTVKNVYRAAGHESIIFKNGSRIDVLASLEGSGHGRIIDLGIIDEAFDDEDSRREQAIIPAMSTRPSAQLLVISTAGTEKSAYLKRKVDAGRDAAANGVTEGIAYFEWSAEADADPYDPATWYGCMPALGRTISEPVIRHASGMPEGEFRRAYLNQWTVSDERVIPAAQWTAVRAPDTKPYGTLAMGIDVNPERTHASIVVADREGKIELVEHTGQGDPPREGIAWVVTRAIELAQRWNMSVALDTRGPAGLFAADLVAAYIVVVPYSGQEMTYACAAVFDAIMDSRVAIRPDPALDAAAAAVTRRQVADAWVWGRRGSGVDVSPIVAMTMAYDLARKSSADEDAWVMVG